MYSREQLLQLLDQNGFTPNGFSEFASFEEGALYQFTIEGTKAIACLNAFRNRVAQTGYWPVILGDADDMRMHRESQTHHPLKPSIAIANAATIDGKQWLDTVKEEEIAAAEEDEEALAPHDEWPNELTPTGTIIGHRAVITGEPLPAVFMGLVPTVNSLEIPAFLNFGGWNSCQKPEEHISVLRYWDKTYALKMVTVKFDVLELQVLKPPTNKIDALHLAEEQFYYCMDIVTQGVESLEALAAKLLNGKFWYFWWD